MLKKLLAKLSPVGVAHAAETDLAPETRAVLDQFLPICAIPHQSGHEEAVSRYLEDWAVQRGLTVVRDAVNNVIIDKPATPGHENAPRTIMQAHMDMVCVAEPGRSFDPVRDPIETVIVGNTLKAKGTTLGADNGVGVAMALCLLNDSKLVHGPLRAIFTVDEEAGMSGVSALDAKFAEGAYLINLDGEDYDILCNSCASCAHMEFVRSVSWCAPKGDTASTLTVRGLQGGHSGGLIHLGRANAIREVGSVLTAARAAGLHPEIAAFTGGIADNAIPDSAEAVVVLPAGEMDAFRALVETTAALFAKAYAGIEPSAAFALTAAAMPTRVLEASHTAAALRFLSVAPNGVRSMSFSSPGHTESSSSIGILRLSETDLEIHMLARSSMLHHMNQMLLMSEGLSELCGFTRRPCVPSPGWAEDPQSRLQPLFRATFEEVTGTPMGIEPTHGGLECGWFARKNDKLDMVAIGPRVTNPHSPEETLYLDTIPGMYKTLMRVIEKLA